MAARHAEHARNQRIKHLSGAPGGPPAGGSGPKFEENKQSADFNKKDVLMQAGLDVIQMP